MNHSNQAVREAILQSNIYNPDFIILDMEHWAVTDHYFVDPYEFKPRSTPKRWYVCLNLLIKNRTDKRFTGDFTFQLCDYLGPVVATSRIKMTIPAKNSIDLYSEWIPVEKEYSHTGSFKVFFNGKKLIEYEYNIF